MVDDTIMALYRTWHRHTGDRFSFALTTAKNRCTDRLRQRGSRARTLRQLNGPAGAPKTAASHDPQIERRIDRERAARLLEDFLANWLSDEDRDLYNLRYRQGQSQAELAERFGLSDRGIAKRLAGIAARFKRYHQLACDRDFCALGEDDRQIALAIYVGGQTQEAVGHRMARGRAYVRTRLGAIRQHIPWLVCRTEDTP